ncbi:uncharacterized protein PODANS_1_5240 [Podospora anserina S mat+]|uniref:Podospora anserina S mat+ genomic DNA chromosome 1, supercontig 1 n=3 Tax=Podospora TaxID=5144 RepID=B2AAU9_PODAN|nr:uncharacterized protein PODANS_1_5240 [Podospora anserina S mat+]KAK4647872.1 hypothetical protein QC761_105240 [Podospora bellae-mahoneyi]KAK4681182.1 hypothetical protein QC764_105240 [Podospora pseudoanserina]CAP60211.1 unnamed protein product [Podospora anserina S mat+]CDP22852.1 Putative protein of unknown function [Podospora anserina S mat+]
MADQAAAPPQPPTQLIKFSVYLYKKEDIDYDEFLNWVTKEYPSKAAPIMKRHGIVQWTQTVTPPHFRTPFRAALQHMGRDKWTVPDYDVVMSYWIPTPDTMQALTQDPEWIELETKEAMPRANMTVGHFEIGHEIVQFGEVRSQGTA